MKNNHAIINHSIAGWKKTKLLEKFAIVLQFISIFCVLFVISSWLEGSYRLIEERFTTALFGVAALIPLCSMWRKNCKTALSLLTIDETKRLIAYLEEAPELKPIFAEAVGKDIVVRFRDYEFVESYVHQKRHEEEQKEAIIKKQQDRQDTERKLREIIRS